MTDGRLDLRAPSRTVSIAVAAVLVIVWGTIRLLVFQTTMFPLTYAVPLLVCVWTRDRLVLWSMAAVFVALHAMKLFWLLPPGTLSNAEIWTNFSATVTNVSVAAVAVHAIVRLRERVERSLGEVQAHAEDLRASREVLAQQNEELAQQAEELSRQTEELTQQGEELASQNEELEAQAEQIGSLNETLGRRGALLQSLLEFARLSSSERAALQKIADAALGLFGGDGLAVALYERTEAGLRARAFAGGSHDRATDQDAVAVDDFVALVLHERRTASLHDVSLRPDLRLVRVDGQQPFRAVLSAPIRFAADVFGALAVYSRAERDWTDEEFRLAEWLASQCAGALQTLRTQAELRAADQRKGEFLATLSHELRNPLAPIGFALQLIEAGKGDVAHASRVMRRQFQQLVRLVDDLLDATRLTSNKIQIRKTRADLVPLVQHAVEASTADSHAPHHDIVVTTPPGPVWVDADPDRIAQVVTNLVQNATRYTPPGGRVTVAVTASSAEALLSVSDTGVGLKRQDLQRVFDMFTQVGGPGSGGLGIGLALVRGIVELHGGHVEARSDGPGHGSEFRVTLPLAAAQGEVAFTSPEPVAAGTPRRVLVVDDNQDSAEMMGAILALHGHEVRIAHDAEHALVQAREFVPDAALLDIGLPGLNGYELARRLRQDERTRNVHLIALTGWGADGDRLRAGEAGFDLHLTKPAEPRAVLRALAACRGPAPAAAVAPVSLQPHVPGHPPVASQGW